MGQLSKEKIEQAWNSARLIDKSKFGNEEIVNDPDEFRMDDLGGAIIKKTEYGEKSKYGWTIDHALPIAKGGTNHILNLQVAHWKNNEAKGQDFPTFKVVIGLTPKSPFKNIEADFPKFTIHDNYYSELKKIYPNKI